MRLVTDMVEFCTREMPLWHPISISGYHIREAGSTAAQELAFTLADGFTYVEWALARGLDVDEFAPRLSFFFNAHLDFFEEIAKYRAARRIWATQMRDRYGAKDPRSWLMRFHTQTAGVSLTAQQPEVNLIRTAIEALAAVLGGTQSLHTNTFDEALALPTEHAARLALRTQQVIAHETGVVNTIDPLGGSYFVEQLTTSWNGRPTTTSSVSTSSAAWSPRSRRTSSSGDRRGLLPLPVRGRGASNASSSASTATGRTTRRPPSSSRSTRRWSASRSSASRRCARSATPPPSKPRSPSSDAPPQSDVNLMPPIIDASREYVTMGEMCDALREVWGIWRETPVF